MQNKLTKIIPTAIIALLALVIYVAVQGRVQAQVPPAAAAPGSTLEQRVAQRKAERNVALAEKDQTRLVSVCVNAQGKLRTMQQKTTPAINERAKLDQQIDAKLWIMIGKLKLSGKDTFAFEKQRATLAQKTAASQLTAKEYSQVLDDVVAVNCKADVVGFKALLDTARIYRTQLRDQLADSRTYINNEVKPALSAFATELQSKPSTEETQ